MLEAGYIEMHADDDITLGNWLKADYDILMPANENGVGGVDSVILAPFSAFSANRVCRSCRA